MAMSASSSSMFYTGVDYSDQEISSAACNHKHRNENERTFNSKRIISSNNNNNDDENINNNNNRLFECMENGRSLSSVTTYSTISEEEEENLINNEEYNNNNIDTKKKNFDYYYNQHQSTNKYNYNMNNTICTSETTSTTTTTTTTSSCSISSSSSSELYTNNNNGNNYSVLTPQAIVLPKFQSGSKHDKIKNLHFRSILPKDREQIQRLHEEWFPVKYQDEFYDELVYGRMVGSGDELFTCVAVQKKDNNNNKKKKKGNNSNNKGDNHVIIDDDDDDNNDNDEIIVACVVGAFVHVNGLPKSTTEILVNDIYKHPKLFYIMTVGTIKEYRYTGLATYLISLCINIAYDNIYCGVIYLHVHTHNKPAIKMYEKLGFYRVQEINNYYNINNILHNCYLYAQYYNGNRGHRALSKIIAAFLALMWQRLLNTTYYLSSSFDDYDDDDDDDNNSNNSESSNNNCEIIEEQQLKTNDDKNYSNTLAVLNSDNNRDDTV